jgi:hypothetical protein
MPISIPSPSEICNGIVLGNLHWATFAPLAESVTVALLPRSPSLPSNCSIGSRATRFSTMRRHDRVVIDIESRHRSRQRYGSRRHWRTLEG